MDFLDLTLPSLEENLALDEALLLEAEAGQGGEVLRLWEWPTPAVVLGAAGQLAAEVNEEACRADDVPIVRRASGGGTVLLGSGCLCFSLVLAYDRDPALREIPSSYRFILERICSAFLDLLPGLETAGTSDLAFEGRKISGNAQQRKRRYLLHHGTLLHHFDIARVRRYLKPPSRQPDYRARREHADFLMNLPADTDLLRQQLHTVWQAETLLPTWPQARVLTLVQEKYTQPGWLRRR